MSPENQWLEDVFPIVNSPFIGSHVGFPGLKKIPEFFNKKKHLKSTETKNLKFLHLHHQLDLSPHEKPWVSPGIPPPRMPVAK